MKLDNLIETLKKEASTKPIGSIAEVINALEEFEAGAVFVHEANISDTEKIAKVQAFARETFIEIYPSIHAFAPEKTEALLDTVLAKNADYGDSFGNLVRKYGDVAMSIRISDKLSRLKSLTSGNKQQVKDESIEDTLLDSCGYTLLAMVYAD